MSQLDLQALQLFLDIVELGSVSRAATRHGVAQPSVTARVQKLERQLKLQLLERSSTGSTPTAAGRQLAASAIDVLNAASALESAAATLTRPVVQQLSIASTTTTTRNYLPTWVARADLGSTSISLRRVSTVEAASAVRRGDVALSFLDGPAAPLGLRSVVVAEHELVAVGAPNHPLLRVRRIHGPEQLAAAPLIGQARGSGTRDCIEGALTPFGLQEFHLTVSSLDEALLGAISGAGIAILPRASAEDDLLAGRLGLLATRGITIQQPIRAAWRGTKPADAAARQLLAAASG